MGVIRALVSSHDDVMAGIEEDVDGDLVAGSEAGMHDPCLVNLPKILREVEVVPVDADGYRWAQNRNRAVRRFFIGVHSS